MTGEEFKDALRSLGMTQRAFARLLDMPDQSISRWAKGHYPVPGWAIVVLELLAERDELRRSLPG